MGKETKYEQTLPPLQKCSIVGIIMFNRSLAWISSALIISIVKDMYDIQIIICFKLLSIARGDPLGMSIAIDFYNNYFV